MNRDYCKSLINARENPAKAGAAAKSH